MISDRENDLDSIIREDYQEKFKEYRENLKKMDIYSTKNIENQIESLKKNLESIQITNEDKSDDLKAKEDFLTLLNIYASSLLELRNLLCFAIGSENLEIMLSSIKIKKHKQIKHKILNRSIRQLRRYKFDEPLPKKLVTKKNLNNQQTIYLDAVLKAPFTLPKFVMRSLYIINNKKEINKHLHIYINTLKSIEIIETKTSEEIKELTGIVLKDKKDSVVKQISELQKSIERKNKAYESALKNFTHSDDRIRNKFKEEIKKYNEKIKSCNKHIRRYEADIKKIETAIRKEEKVILSQAEEERQVYLDIENINKSPSKPNKLIWDYNTSINKFIRFTPAVFITENSEQTKTIQKLIAFQLRNYMINSSLNIINLDNSMIGALDDFQDTKDVDILYEDKDIKEYLEMVYTNMVSNRNAIKGFDNTDIYNEHAKKIDSALLPMYYISWYVRDLPSINTELYQMLTAGLKYGIVIHIFIEQNNFKDFNEIYIKTNLDVFIIKRGEYLNESTKTYIVEE